MFNRLSVIKNKVFKTKMKLKIKHKAKVHMKIKTSIHSVNKMKMRQLTTKVKIL